MSGLFSKIPTGKLEEKFDMVTISAISRGSSQGSQVAAKVKRPGSVSELFSRSFTRKFCEDGSQTGGPSASSGSNPDTDLLAGRVSAQDPVGSSDDWETRSHGELSADTLIMTGKDDEPRAAVNHCGDEPPSASAPPQQTCVPAKQADLMKFFQPGKNKSPSGSIQPVCWDECFDAPGSMSTPRVSVTSLNDMLNWPTQYNKALSATLPSGALEFLRNRLEQSTYSTCFSGVDAPGSAMAMIAQDLRMALGVSGHVMYPRHLSAIEIYGPSQQELLVHPSRPRHLYKSVLDLLSDEAREFILEEKDYSKLLAFAKAKGHVKNHAGCLIHGCDCDCLTAELHVAGIICVSWSPMGKGRKTDGDDYPLFLAWVMTRRFLQEPIVLWECSGRYDESIMNAHLADLYICFAVPANALSWGFAANRPRKYGLCLLKSDVTPRFSSLENVIRLFHRDRTEGFEMVLVASEKHLHEDLAWAKSRPKSCAKNMTLEEVLQTKNPWWSVLTKYEQSNLENYKKQFGCELTVNLNQSATNFPVVSKIGSDKVSTMYALIHNSGISWCCKADRFMAPQELALLQGLDAVPIGSVRTTSFAVDRPRSRTAFAGQVGNSMCTAIVGSFLYVIYLLTSLRSDIRTSLWDRAENEILPEENLKVKIQVVQPGKKDGKKVEAKLNAKAKGDRKRNRRAGKNAKVMKDAKVLKRPAAK